ncbi:MAG TPA: hypothetical protein ENN22_15350 [bacterium]|nr:hypothetical protein [bacterium]
MDILGISAYYHDSAACLVRDGKILAAAQEERFTRKKHDFNFPHHAIQYCLSAGGITAGDLDYVAFYDKPFLKFERLLESYLAYAPLGIRSFIKAMPVWLKQKLWIKEQLKKGLSFDGPVIFPSHHESHAASAFFPSPFQQAAFLTIDGVGEWNTTTFGTAAGNQIQILGEMNFPHSLGLLYSAFTYYTGFKVNSGEYKLMGLAPYGEPRFVRLILDELIDLKPDGSFKLNLKYFNYCVGLTMTSRKFHRLFGGPPRQPESPITQRDMDIARSIQEVTEDIMLRMARFVRQQTGQSRLCLAGGCALNCVANGRILREGVFDDIWIQPAAGDAGGAVGAALLVWHQLLEKPRLADNEHDFQQASCLGPVFSDEEIAAVLKRKNAPFQQLEKDEIVSKTAQLIDEQNVVGWFQGRMEFGPRALGCRSILGDARSAEMQTMMNLKIKYRESFRPFAPSVLAEHVADYFDIHRNSPYMLLVAPLATNKRRDLSAEESAMAGMDKLKIQRSVLPAITHVDYSARIQTVDQRTNGLYYDLLRAFYQHSGCPVIINTSFNVRGEPIVCTPEDAYTCFMRTEMDYLVMGSFLLNKKEQPDFDDKIDWLQQFDLD